MRRRVGLAPTVATVAALLAAVPPSRGAEADAAFPSAAPNHGGSLAVFLENDIVFDSDDNYTAGLGVGWTSDDAASYRGGHWVPGIVRATAFLPAIGDAGFRSFVSFSLGQEMYTPTDIEAPVPPPDEQPYAGVLYLDTSIYAHGRRSMHGFTLRLGCVGPCSGAEGAQRWLHEQMDSPIPQGWTYQLSNEPLLNVSYRWDRRLIRRANPSALQGDLSLGVGAGLGNYYTGTNVGLIGRLGCRLPDNYGTASFRTGGTADFVGLAPEPDPTWHGWLFVGLQAFLVGRFLPTDGNTFEDGPSAERDTLQGDLSVGLAVGYGRFRAAWIVNNLVNSSDPGSRADDHVTFTVGYQFRARRRPPEAARAARGGTETER